MTKPRLGLTLLWYDSMHCGPFGSGSRDNNPNVQLLRPFRQSYGSMAVPKREDTTLCTTCYLALHRSMAAKLCTSRPEVQSQTLPLLHLPIRNTYRRAVLPVF